MDANTKLREAARLLQEVSTELEAQMGRSTNNQELRAYLSAKIMHGKHRQAIYSNLLKAAMHIVQGEGAGLTLYNPKRQRLIFEAAVGLGADSIIGYEVPLEGSVHGLAYALNETQVSASLHKDISSQANASFDNVLVTPIRSGDLCLGTMSAVNKQGERSFNNQDIKVFEDFAKVAASLIEAYAEDVAVEAFDPLVAQLELMLDYQSPSRIASLLKSINMHFSGDES